MPKSELNGESNWRVARDMGCISSGDVTGRQAYLQDHMYGPWGNAT